MPDDYTFDFVYPSMAIPDNIPVASVEYGDAARV